MSAYSASMSTIFPLPSSPHWAPTTTTVLPIFPSYKKVLAGKFPPLSFFEGRYDIFHIKGKAGGFCRIAVFFKEAVVSSAAKYRLSDIGGKTLKYYARVIVKPPHLSKVYGNQIHIALFADYIQNLLKILKGQSSGRVFFKGPRLFDDFLFSVKGGKGKEEFSVPAVYFAAGFFKHRFEAKGVFFRDLILYLFFDVVC